MSGSLNSTDWRFHSATKIRMPGGFRSPDESPDSGVGFYGGGGGDDEKVKSGGCGRV